MLSEAIKSKLKGNWGEKAAALECYAEVKFIDPLSSWCCYVFAMDSEEHLIDCLLYSHGFGVENCTLCMYELERMYNIEGEAPIIDKEYRRTWVKELLKGLKNDT